MISPNMAYGSISLLTFLTRVKVICQKAISLIYKKIFWQNALRSWFLGMHFGPNFGGMEGRRESTIVPFERAIVVSYKLSIVTFVLSLTIRPQFAIECL